MKERLLVQGLARNTGNKISLRAPPGRCSLFAAYWRQESYVGKDMGVAGYKVGVRKAISGEIYFLRVGMG